MIEQTIVDYLKKQFPDEIVDTETPHPMPYRFITVEKTGSQQLRTGLFSSTVAVQSWEARKINAAKLSELVCKALRKMPDEVPEVSEATGSDYDFTDTTTKRYRYQAVFTIIHY